MPDTTLNGLTATPAHYPKERVNLDTRRVHCRCGNSIVIAPEFWDGDTWTCTQCGTPVPIAQSHPAAKDDKDYFPEKTQRVRFPELHGTGTVQNNSAQSDEEMRKQIEDYLSFRAIKIHDPTAPVVKGRISVDVKSDPIQVAKDFIVNAVTTGAHPNDLNFHDRLEAAKFIVLTARESGW